MNSLTQQKLLVKLSLLGIILYPLLFVWQGLDFTDMGYCLVSYQNFLRAPTGILGWCNCAFGWLFSKLTFDAGILTFKLGAVFLNWTILFLVYSLLRKQLPEKQLYLLPPILLFTLVFCTRYYWTWLSYNHFTALFYILMVWFLYNGLTKSSLWLIFFAGCCTVVNIFIRFPNILGLCFIGFIFLYAWTKKYSLKKTCVWTGAYILGMLCAFLLILLMIWVCGHWQMVVESIAGILHKAGDKNEGRTYYIGNLLLLFYLDYKHVLLTTSAGITLIFILTQMLKQNKMPYNIIIFSVLSLAIYPIMWRIEWLVPGLIYITLISTFFYYWRKDDELSFLSLLAATVLFIAPLGSNNGIFNSIYGNWLAFPLTVLILIRLACNFSSENRLLSKLHIERKFLQTAGVLLLITIFIGSLYTKLFSEFRDHTRRYRMLYSINEPYLAGVFTTKERAKTVSELLQELKEHTYPGMTVLGYNGVATVYFLTQTIPYLTTPWPVLMSKEKVHQALKEKSQSHLPKIVFRATGGTSTNYWPKYPQNKKIFQGNHESRRVLDEFVKEHGYKLIWENDFFEVLQLETETSGFANKFE